jgi:hypothetical protein
VGNAAAELNGALLGGGVRFHMDNWGIDLSLMRGLDVSNVVLPLLVISYRS